MPLEYRAPERDRLAFARRPVHVEREVELGEAELAHHVVRCAKRPGRAHLLEELVSGSARR